MCCRYLFADKASTYIRSKTKTINGSLQWNLFGDIHPTDKSIILYGNNQNQEKSLCASQMNWGFETKIPSSTQKQIIINARAESIISKPLFSDSVENRRCIIVADSFYEWNSLKEKNTFSNKENDVLLMAGIYKRFENLDHFVILTTEANAIMSPVHDRMPLILEEDMINDWIFDNKAYRELLKYRTDNLVRTQEYEQLSLF